jgi:hypothetical protein
MELVDLLRRVIEALEALGIPYLVTGSVASMAYGEPRLTNDIDVVAAFEVKYIEGFLKRFPQNEFYISEEMVREAIRHRSQFNIIHPSSGLKVDVIIKEETPFDNSRFKRIRRISPEESYQANFASPEDVIIKKMEYYKEGGSEKHLRDITGILRVTGDAVDRGYIREWAERMNLVEIWEAIQKRLKVDDPSR